MPIVQTPVGMPPFQVDNFGPKCERSCSGALYLRPSSTKQVTKGELEHLLDRYPQAKRFVVIEDPPKKQDKAKAVAKPKPKSTATPAASASVNSDEESTDPGVSSRGRRDWRGGG